MFIIEIDFKTHKNAENRFVSNYNRDGRCVKTPTGDNISKNSKEEPKGKAAFHGN